MAKNQRCYTNEFKRQMVDFYGKSSKSIVELSSEYGLLKSKQYQEFSDKVKSILRLQKKIRCSKNSERTRIFRRFLQFKAGLATHVAANSQHRNFQISSKFRKTPGK